MALSESVLAEIRAMKPAQEERERWAQYSQAVQRLGPIVRQQAADELTRKLAEHLRL